MRILFLVTASLLILSLPALAGPAGINIQGRLLNNGVAVESAAVTLTLKVTSIGTSECTLYEETHPLNMAGTDGIMSVTLGEGSRTGNDKGFALVDVFSNKPIARSGLSCTGGNSTYTPAAATSRNVYVSFDDNGNTVAFSDPLVLQTVPYALEAERISGLAATDLLQTTTDSTQNKLNTIMVPTTYAELLALINGTSSRYATTSNGSFSSNIDLNNNKITDLASPTAATDAANKQYVDNTLATKATDVATLSALNSGDSGKVLSWNGTQWTALSPAADTTKLSLSGGTMAGPIAMSSNNITAAGYIMQSPGKFTQLGSFDDTTEATMVGTLTAAYKGATWYNTTSNQLKYWTGSAVKTMDSGAVTTVAVAPPLASSGGTTPTLSIGRSTASSDGFLAATDFSAFNSKQSSSLTSGHILVGNGSGSATDVALSGDAEITSAGAMKVTALQNKSVSPVAPVAQGQVLLYDGSSSWAPAFVGLNDLRSSVLSTNNLFPTNPCSSSQTMIWSAITDTFNCTNITLTEAQIPQLTSASKVANSATTATSTNTVSTIVARDGSGNFVASDVSVNRVIASNGVVLSDNQGTPNKVTLVSPSAISTSYSLKLPTALPGNSGYVLSSDTSGNLSWLAPSTGSVTNVAAAAPLSSSGGPTPSISLSKATTSADGYLAASDFSAFNNKQSTSLAQGKVWLGNGSGVAAQGFIGFGDIRSGVNSTNTLFPSTACTSSQTMIYSAVTDSFNCTNISFPSSVASVTATAPLVSSGGTTPSLSLAKSTSSVDGYLASSDFTAFSNKQSNTLATGKVWVGNGSNAANAVFLGLSDIRSSVTATSNVFPSSACTSSQTMIYSAVTDTFTCTAIALADTQITYASQSANRFLASPSGAAGTPVYRGIAAMDLPVTGNGGAIVNGGNTFGATSNIGNSDSNNLNLVTAGSPRVTVAAAGNVGVGNATPSTKLDVNGQFKSGFVSHASLNTNWLSGNIQSSSVSAGTLTFTSSSMFDGANYTLILTSAGTYTLSTTGDITTWRCLPACGGNQITATGHTVLTIIKAGTTGYVSWLAGF